MTTSARPEREADAGPDAGSEPRGKRPSLARQLLLYLLWPMVLLVALAVALSAVVASRSINAVYDAQMRSKSDILMAFVLYELVEHESDTEYDDDDDDDGDGEREDDDNNDVDDDLIELVEQIESTQNIEILYRLRVGRQTQFTSARIRHFPVCAEGFSNLSSDIIGDGQDWRCFRQTRLAGTPGIPVDVEFFEPVQSRRAAIRSLLLTTLAPLLFLPLLLILITRREIRRVVRWIQDVSRDVSQRSVSNLQRIESAGKPEELVPIVASVNDLLRGVEVGIEREKQFTDDAAHELRTPVTSIKMLEQLIRRENADPTLEKHLDKLGESADHSAQLIEQLLRLARLQSLQTLDKTPLNLGELLEDQLGMLSPQLTDRGLAVDLDIADSMPNVHADRAALALLINNVLINAIKFSPVHGTVYIRLTAKTLRIEDDGPGIRPAERVKVFDRFYRGSNGRVVDGTGLGLPLARGIAESHGFALTIESARFGSGAAFVLAFHDALIESVDGSLAEPHRS